MVWSRPKIGVTVAAGTILCVYAAASMFARGERTFFSPYTLECQSQTELLLPMTRIPIFRSLRHSHRYELVEYLIKHGYWTAVENDAAPLLTDQWNLQWRDGQSDIQRQFAWQAKQWIEWNDQHPDMAAKLWPQVLQLLRSDIIDDRAYASQLMFYARRAATGDELSRIVAADIELASAIDRTNKASTPRVRTDSSDKQ